MSAFSERELASISPHSGASRVWPRWAGDGTPHAVPVGFTYNPEHDSIDIGGHDLRRTKKFRDVARSGRAAVVIDDLVKASSRGGRGWSRCAEPPRRSRSRAR